MEKERRGWRTVWREKIHLWPSPSMLPKPPLIWASQRPSHPWTSPSLWGGLPCLAGRLSSNFLSHLRLPRRPPWASPSRSSCLLGILQSASSLLCSLSGNLLSGLPLIRSAAFLAPLSATSRALSLVVSHASASRALPVTRQVYSWSNKI